MFITAASFADKKSQCAFPISINWIKLQVIIQISQTKQWRSHSKKKLVFFQDRVKYYWM